MVGDDLVCDPVVVEGDERRIGGEVPLCAVEVVVLTEDAGVKGVSAVDGEHGLVEEGLHQKEPEVPPVLQPLDFVRLDGEDEKAHQPEREHFCHWRFIDGFAVVSE